MTASLFVITDRFTPTRVGNTSDMSSIFPLFIWFTPTRVGNTLSAGDFVVPVPVHPHACGEYSDDLAGMTARVWFTPTRVGNTSTGRLNRPLAVGSPPRVWGIRLTQQGFQPQRIVYVSSVPPGHAPRNRTNPGRV